MKMLAALSLCALLAAAMLGGGAPFGRVLMAAGMPGLASGLFTDPDWRGVALFRAGDFTGAAAEFARADSFYNLGNAEAHAGRHAAALEAYDLAEAGGHPDARANFDVVAAFYAGLNIDPAALALFPERKLDGPQADSSIARGSARAAGTGSEVTNSSTMLGLTELQSRGQQGVRRVFDDKFMVADERWLEQLGDVPGEYMAARILQEHKRREKLGLSPPPPEDPR